MISDKNKFIYIHIPKTAGESIEEALAGKFKDVRLISNKAAWGWPIKHDTIIEYDTSMKESLNNFFSFSLVRNPWDRMVSLWHYLLVPKTPGGFVGLFREVDFGGHPTIESVSFEEFVFNFRNIMKHARNTHWWNPYRKYMFAAPQLDFITSENGEIELDFVGRFEDLQNDFNYICKKLNIDPIKLPHKNKTSRKPYQEYYKTQELIDEVGRRYKKDIEYFKYNFNDNL